MDPKVRESEGFGEDYSGKKKSKFKSFKKLFGKKKRKETLSSSGSSSLKLFQSTSDVTASQGTRVGYDSEDELDLLYYSRTHKGIMGSRALSHDSIFIPETGQEPARPVRVFSQENISDRIRALQLKLQHNMKLGPPPPFGLHAKRSEDAGTSSEDDGLPRSPPETSLLQETLNSGMTRFSDSHKHLSSLSLAGTGSEEEEQVTLGPSSRPHSTASQLFPRHASAKTGGPRISDSSISPAANFDTPPELSSCLDNSAARHKLLIKPRNQRSSKMRRFSQRTQSESLTDLSCTPEEEEDDDKEMQTDLPDALLKTSEQELPCSTAAAQDVASWQKPRMPEDLPPVLRPAMTQSASESAAAQEALLPENKPEGCQPTQETVCTKPESSLLLEGEDYATSPYSSLDREIQKQKDSSETLALLSGDECDASVNTLNQEHKELPSVSSVCNIPFEEDISLNKHSLVCLDGSEENIQDHQILVEMSCNKEAKKEVAVLSESVQQFPIGSFQHVDSFVVPSHIPHPTSTQMGSSTSRALGKTKTTEEAAPSDKENCQLLAHKQAILGKKAEKAASELNALRKFSVSSARERPRTRSLHFPESSECESPLNTRFFLSKVKVSLRNERWKDLQAGSDLEDGKSYNRKQTLLPESSCEIIGQSMEMLPGCVSQTVDAGPVPSDSSVVSQSQPSCEDKNPFQVKLRSTSLSLKYGDNSSQESKEIKRYSAEFNLEGEGLTSFLKGEKAQIKKTDDTNIGGSLNRNIKSKAKSFEQLSGKPPLPKKPVLQNLTLLNTNANREKQDKVIQSSESRNEDRDLEKKSSPCKVPERSVPSPVITGDSGREPDSPAEPAWITIARQKQRGTQQEQELNREKLVTPDVKSDTEKHSKEKERTEGSVKQHWNKPSHVAPKSSSEEQRKETKSEMKELLPRTNSLSHFVPVAQSPALVDKEGISYFKKASNAAADQPSWMELAKKKSQAWSDMPQIIK
ncbi:CRACD-like protein isoform X2 [Dromaius novaehollandiae]|uniref:CRACD-like protein isoform X2 n=1 Tax=Dromaius novaehollandiae TaxID=8790 RepID=UPI00311E31D7